MLTWSQAFFGGHVVSPVPSAPCSPITDTITALDGGSRPKFGRRLIWHTGNGNNHAAIFDYFPDDDLTVVMMTNNTSPTDSTATLLIEGKTTTFPANAGRKLVEQVERLYFGRAP